MNLRDLGIPLLTFSIGVAAGLATLSRSQEKPGDSDSGAASSSASNSLPGGPAASLAAPAGFRRRPESPRGPDGPCVAIPMETVAGFLKSNGFLGDASFDSLGRQMKDPMTLLGVPASNQENVITMLAAARDEVLAEEKTRFKIAERTDPSSITVDLSGMEEPAARITAQTRQRLVNLLPPEAAQVLSEAVNWDHYYFGYEGPKASFSIARNDNGLLTTRQTTAEMTMRDNVDPSLFPDDGTPIPADKLVEDPRWKAIYAGQTLLPPAP